MPIDMKVTTKKEVHFCAHKTFKTANEVANYCEENNLMVTSVRADFQKGTSIFFYTSTVKEDTKHTTNE
jgi:hypothetical protein